MKLTDRKGAFVVKPMYRVKELATLLGVSRWALLRMLKRHGVEVVDIGNGNGRKVVVPLVSFRFAFPELWESILLARSLSQ